MTVLSKNNIKDILTELSFEVIGTKSIPKFSEYLGVTKQALYSWINNQEIPIDSIRNKVPNVNPLYLRWGELPILIESSIDKTPTSRIINLLKNTGYNQPELSEIIPFSVSTLSRWFSGKTKHIDKRKRELISNRLGFDFYFIENGTPLQKLSTSNDNQSFSSFHEALRSYLTSNGIKQSYLVERTGIDKTSMSHYKNGRHIPGKENKLLIESALGVSFIEQLPNKWVIEKEFYQGTNTYFPSFGSCLKHLLTDRGLKQNHLVEKANKGADEISRYVNDKVVPVRDTQILLGNILGVVFNQLGTGEWEYHSKLNENHIGNYKTRTFSEISTSELIENLDQVEAVIEEYKELKNGKYSESIMKRNLDSMSRELKVIVRSI